MTIQKIMAPFLKKDTGLAAFDAAAALADRFSAHLDVVYMRPPITVRQFGSAYYPIAVDYVESTIDALNERADQQAADLKELYEARCAKYEIGFCDAADHTESKGPTARWSDVDPRTSYDFAKRARVADMAVVAKSAADTPQDEIELIEELVFQSGRPVLITPVGRKDVAFPGTIMIAWDGGCEAARAIAAAMPILKEARLVIVTSVGEIKSGGEPVDHVATYLGLHGVHATTLAARPDKGETAEEAFLRYADIKDADLIVMGAYSHSRWREVIWGGFTRHLLRASEIPLLMAH